MNRITEISLLGKTYPLNYSVKAAQILGERFGGSTREVIQAIVREGEPVDATAVTDNVLYIAEVLIKYGALYRKHIDGVDCDTLTAEDMSDLLSKAEYLSLFSAILQAIATSQGRMIEAEEDRKNAEATQD